MLTCLSRQISKTVVLSNKSKKEVLIGKETQRVRKNQRVLIQLTLQVL